ncbi:hypothetical protein GRI38_11380 [Altererythrobacter aurantiacus]|uniref:GIY-YIG domain-containing protein n=1 Tax=Parapontixanthobacter aurantiacus TaxID=1463599 RepID=A0A844ZHL5_9SPHN|nr:hypothetical protein [Parapontixanthobacter aurantiacus]MXO86626.1 hypothetical protein [Parapontixanthobacter aurantiacus]
MSWRLKDWYVLSEQTLSRERDDRTVAKSEWHALSDAWRQVFTNKEDKALHDIWNAVYVIWISIPLTFDYGALTNPTAYIGKGMAHARFRDHIDSKLMPTLDLLKGAKFDFWVLECASDDIARSSEAKMLQFFEETYGRLPIFNKSRPSPTAAKPHPDCWKPLDRRRAGRQRTWAVRPI